MGTTTGSGIGVICCIAACFLQFCCSCSKTNKTQSCARFLLRRDYNRIFVLRRSYLLQIRIYRGFVDPDPENGQSLYFAANAANEKRSQTFRLKSEIRLLRLSRVLAAVAANVQQTAGKQRICAANGGLTGFHQTHLTSHVF